jgi:hypothetical protein
MKNHRIFTVGNGKRRVLRKETLVPEAQMGDRA